MLPEYTPGANLYDYAFYGNMQTDDNVNTFRYQVGGTPWSQQQQQQQQGGGNEQLIEYIQMYSEITQQDPNDIYEKVSSMSQEDQQAALQEIVGTIQEYYTMQQSRQQDQMVDEQGESMYGDEEEDEYASPQKPIVSPTPDEIAGLEEEAEYDAAVEAATADYDEEYMYGGSKKRGRNKFTSQLKKAARGMAQEMVNTDSVPTGTSSYGGERLKKFVSGIQRNVANNMAEEAFNQSMDYFEQPEMMRYGGFPRYQGSTDGSQVTGQGCPPGDVGCIPQPGSQTTQNITLTPEQFNQLLARQYSNQGYYPGNYGGYGGYGGRGLGSLLHMFGAAPISNDWYMPRGYRMTNRSQKDLKDQLMLSGKIPLEASYLSNVEATKGFLGNIYNPRKISMQFSRALPPINFVPSENKPGENTPSSSSWNQDIRVNTNPSDITIPPVTIGSGTQVPSVASSNSNLVTPVTAAPSSNLTITSPVAAAGNNSSQSNNVQSASTAVKGTGTSAKKEVVSGKGSKTASTKNVTQTYTSRPTVESRPAVLTGKSKLPQPKQQEKKLTTLEKLLPGYQIFPDVSKPASQEEINEYTRSRMQAPTSGIPAFAPRVPNPVIQPDQSNPATEEEVRAYTQSRMGIPSSSINTRQRFQNPSPAPNVLGRMLPGYNMFQRGPLVRVNKNNAVSSDVEPISEQEFQSSLQNRMAMPSSSLNTPAPRYPNPRQSSFKPGFSLQFLTPRQQKGGQLYLYRDGGLPRFQGPDASQVTLAPASISNPGQSAKTFGDSDFAMEPFDNSALVAARSQPMQLPTKTLQEVTAEAGANPSMKTLKADFVKNPLTASQWADIAYSGTNLVTNLKNRADQELAQAQMLERETDPINYTPSTFANFDGGIEANLGDPARKYTSFMGQRQQFSPGVTSGFGKFGGVLKYGGTYEMDLSPEEIAYIQRMGGTIEYI